MTTPTTSEKYLSQMLEGYESGITGVDNFITETTTSLEKAKEQKQEMLDSIEEIKEALGLDGESKEPAVKELSLL
tara:strand:- start:302 stop:526 length:225 start_codon:yes stop_codon:yes gene_type:complete